MEFEDVDERVAWEARRVAAAFGVETFHREDAPTDQTPNSGTVGFPFKGLADTVIVAWVLDRQSARLESVELGAFKSCCLVRLADKRWRYRDDPSSSHIMTCGLYRLGFEDEGVWSQLPELSAHEKLELRLSMPREFWPKK